MKRSKPKKKSQEHLKHEKYISELKLGGNPNKYGKAKPSKKVVQLSPEIPSWATELKKFKSVETNSPINNDAPIVYEGELAEREVKARQELERKKQFVAVAYNKGGYVYLGENPPEEIVKSIGKK